MVSQKTNLTYLKPLWTGAHKKKIWNERNKSWGRNTFYDHIINIGFGEVREGENSVRMFGGLKLIPKNYEDYESRNNNDTIIC